MAEAADELSAPLGRDNARGKRHFRLPFTGVQLLAAALGLFLATFAGYALFNDDPFGGEPRARAQRRRLAAVVREHEQVAALLRPGQRPRGAGVHPQRVVVTVRVHGGDND